MITLIGYGPAPAAQLLHRCGERHGGGLTVSAFCLRGAVINRGVCIDDQGLKVGTPTPLPRPLLEAVWVEIQALTSKRLVFTPLGNMNDPTARPLAPNLTRTRNSR